MDNKSKCTCLNCAEGYGGKTGWGDREYGVGNGVTDQRPPKASRERDSEVEGEGCSWGPGYGWNLAEERGREIRAEE